jgi:hypothetical protein
MPSPMRVYPFAPKRRSHIFRRPPWWMRLADVCLQNGPRPCARQNRCTQSKRPCPSAILDPWDAARFGPQVWRTHQRSQARTADLRAKRTKQHRWELTQTPPCTPRWLPEGETTGCTLHAPERLRVALPNITQARCGCFHKICDQLSSQWSEPLRGTRGASSPSRSFRAYSGKKTQTHRSVWRRVHDAKDAATLLIPQPLQGVREKIGTRRIGTRLSSEALRVMGVRGTSRCHRTHVQITGAIWPPIPCLLLPRRPP